MMVEESSAGPAKGLIAEAAAWLAAITSVEIITLFIQPLWGVVGHSVLMVALIVRAARSSDRYLQELTLSLTLLPLLRIIDLSLVLSLMEVNPLLRFPIIYIPPMVGGIVVMRLMRYRRDDIGLILGPARSVLLQIGIATSGFLFGWLEYLILRPEPMVSHLSPFLVVPLALILVASTGFVEEFVFRGVLQRAALNSIGGWRGIIFVSILFAVMHLGFQSWLDVLFVFGVAMFFAWAVKKTGSLLGVVLSHGITNIMLFLVIPFL